MQAYIGSVIEEHVHALEVEGSRKAVEALPSTAMSTAMSDSGWSRASG